MREKACPRREGRSATHVRAVRQDHLKTKGRHPVNLYSNVQGTATWVHRFNPCFAACRFTKRRERGNTDRANQSTASKSWAAIPAQRRTQPIFRDIDRSLAGSKALPPVARSTSGLVIENAQVPGNDRVSQHRPIWNHDYRALVRDDDHGPLVR